MGLSKGRSSTGKKELVMPMIISEAGGKGRELTQMISCGYKQVS